MNRSMAALILLILFAIPAFAQSSPGGPPTLDKVNIDRVRQQEMSSREYQLRNFGTEPSAPKDQRQLKALMAQTEEDFNRILKLHNEIARALTSNDTLNYKFVSEATGEIRKRASRVQSSLALGLSSEEAAKLEKPETKKEAPIKDDLILLCNKIRSFVTNPSIENPNTVNAEQMSKARRDLETLIQLSGQIKKDADKLSKNP